MAERGKISTFVGGSVLPNRAKEITLKTIINHKSSLDWVGNKSDTLSKIKSCPNSNNQSENIRDQINCSNYRVKNVYNLGKWSVHFESFKMSLIDKNLDGERQSVYFQNINYP